MVQAAIAAFILLGVYKFVARKPEDEEEFYVKVDWWLAFAFVFVPSILIFFASIGIATLELPPILILAADTLYFIVPFVTMKSMLDFKAKEALKLAAIVPVVAIATEIPFALLANA